MQDQSSVRVRHDGYADAVVLCAEEVIRDVIVYWLTSIPVHARLAADGYEANRVLSEGGCSLLFTDRILPPWPGLDTFRYLRSRNPSLRIALVDDGTPETRVLARVTGVTSLLPRPLTRRLVVEALARPELVS